MNWRKTLCVLSIAIYSSVCLAQDITDVEAKPYGSYTGGAIDTVDLATGNLMLNIPLISYPQLGSLPPLSFSVALNNAPYSQILACDPSGTMTTGSLDGTYEVECQVYSSRYDTSPPGAVYLPNMDSTLYQPSTPISNPANPNCITGGPACYLEDVWGSEDLSWPLQSMGAYMTSSFEGGIVLGQWESPGWNNCNQTQCGTYQYSVIDPSGTTHELESDASNASTWNTYRTPDGSGYTFIPNLTQLGSAVQNAYDTDAYQDGLGNVDATAVWIGTPLFMTGGVHTGTLYSPDGIQYSDTIQNYAIPPSNTGCSESGEPIYTPRALFSTVKDPSGNTITRGPWYWSGYYSCSSGLPFSDIQSIYASSPPVYRDSVGRTIPDIIAIQSTMNVSGTSTITEPWNVPGPGGVTVPYTITYGIIGNTISWSPGQTVGNPDPSTDIQASGWAISTVTLPNKTQWGFTYSGADIQTVTNPIGGTVSFTYTTIPIIAPTFSNLGSTISTSRCNAVCHAVQSRTETDGLGNSWTTNYSYGVYMPQTVQLSTSVCPSQVSQGVSEQFAFWTTETDPQGNDTVHSFCAVGIPGGSGTPIANEYHEVLTQYYQGLAPQPLDTGGGTKATLLKTVQIQYEAQQDLVDPYSDSVRGTIFVAPIWITTSDTDGSVTETKTYSNDIGQPMFVTTRIICPDPTGPNMCSPSPAGSIKVSYLAPVDDTTKDSMGNPLRDTATTYEFQNPIGSAYTNANLLTLPESVVVSGNGATGTTTYSYDQSTVNGSPQGTQGLLGTYGYLTTKAESYSMGGSTSTQTIYNSIGMPSTKIDGKGNPTIITYDTHGLFPYSIQRPTTYGVQHIDHYSYDLDSGLLNWHTDENGSTTSYLYDLMGRVTAIQYPDGGGSTFCYTDLGGSIPGCSPGPAPYSLYTSTTASPDPTVLTIHSYDGWGRQFRSQILGDAAGPTIVDTTYDWAGRITSVSNPYRGTPVSLASLNSPPCGSSYTCYIYDPFSRKTTQIQPDGTTQKWAYDGLGVIRDFWDETGRLTREFFDSLGRISSATDNVSSASYTYDVFNDLLSVNQIDLSGGASSISRSFSYDMPSRVTWACNPETIASGQGCGSSSSAGVHYNYDGNSNLIQKTDNRSITTNYGYDPLNRLLYKTYSGDSTGTASSCYQYDGTSNGSGKGRLAAQWTQKAACQGNPPALPSSGILTMNTMTDYDQMGRLISEQRCMGISNCATGGYSMNYTYDLSGKLASYQSGFGGLTFTNTYDAIGRLSNVSSSPPSSLFSAPIYTPAGSLSGAQLGPSITMSRSFDQRQRITSETDTGTGNTGNVPGTASVIILGSEQHN